MAAKKIEQAKQESLPQGATDPRKAQAEVVEGLVSKAATDLKSTKKTATLADYIKLVQLQKDLEEDSPRDIRVGWVDHLEKDDGK